MGEKSVLIVDDERRMADSLRSLLDRAGYRAAAAYSGRDAIAWLEHNAAAIVVTDLRMHDVDGLALIRHVHEHHPRSLIIVITGHASTESAIEALHYHVFDYLRKPFEFELFRMAIEKAFQKIETDQLREDMAAMITHDIKIPLTSIIGFASMLWDADGGRFHPRAAEFAETIRSNGDKILVLIENYLTSCKIDSGTLRVVRARVDIPRLVDDVIESIRAQAQRVQRRIETEIAQAPPFAEVDETLVYRAATNLLHNAIKYGKGEAPILFRAIAVAPAETPLGRPALRIEVENESDELSSTELMTLFDRFERDPRHHRIGGTGIGLYVVQAVARAHGGLATARMKPQGVVCFAIDLPLEAIEP